MIIAEECGSKGLQYIWFLSVLKYLSVLVINVRVGANQTFP